MIRSSEFSREMEEAPEADKVSTLFGRNNTDQTTKVINRSFKRELESQSYSSPPFFDFL